MGLIDANLTRDEVSRYITTWKCKDCLKDGGEQLVMAVDDIAYLPTVDAEPVKHARWIWDSNAPHREHGAYKCSNCGCHSDFEENYCYNCGYKMDGGTDDECKKV